MRGLNFLDLKVQLSLLFQQIFLDFDQTVDLALPESNCIVKPCAVDLMRLHEPLDFNLAALHNLM